MNVSFTSVLMRLSEKQLFEHLFLRLRQFSANYIESRLHKLGYKNFKISYLPFLANLNQQGVTSSELAKEVYVSKQMTSKMVSLLEEEGYIYTSKNQNDCRSNLVFLSERGKKLVFYSEHYIQEINHKFESIVGYERTQQMLNTIGELLDGLEKDK